MLLHPHRLFVMIAPIIFGAYALLTPPFQTPDEHQHLFRAWQLAELHLLGERRGNRSGGVLPEGLGHAASPEIGTLEPHAMRTVVQRPARDVFRRRTLPNAGGPNRFYNFFGAVIYSPAGYVPQIVTIWIGRVLGLSVENIVRLGRLLNAALSILLIYVSIRLAPVGALVFAWVGLLPMTAAASASFGQDGLAIGGACFLTALGLRVVINGRWRVSQLLVAAAVTTALTLSKVVYLPLAMIGGQPFSHGSIHLRRLVLCVAICAFAAGLTWNWLNAVSGVVVPPQGGVPPSAERLSDWLHHPTALPVLLEHTYVDHGVLLFHTAFSFGWLDVGPVLPSEILSIASCALVLLAGNTGVYAIDIATRAWLLGIAAAVWLMINVALYLYWTPASTSSILGLQGRYFIPILPALLLPLLVRRDTTARYDLLVTALMALANVFALRAIVTAFYT